MRQVSVSATRGVGLKFIFIAANSGIPRACSVARAPIGKSSCGVKAAFFFFMRGKE